MKDLVIRLLLKTGIFSNDLKTAKSEIQKFEKGCQTTKNAMSDFTGAIGLNVGALGKLAGGVGLAVAAGKEFKDILESSQKTSDAFDIALGQVEGTVQAFNTALATTDFSRFRGGLQSIMEDAKNVKQALDQLEDIQISYGYLSSKNSTKFQEGLVDFKDPDSSPELKTKAKKAMEEAVEEQFQHASDLGRGIIDTYKAEVINKVGGENLNPKDLTVDMFDKAMRVNMLPDSDAEKEKINSRYDEFQDKIDPYRANEKWWKAIFPMWRGKNNNNIMAQEEIKEIYAEDVALYSMLGLMKADQLKDLGQKMNEMEKAKQAALSMEQAMNEATSAGNKATSAGNKTVKTTNQTVKSMDDVNSKQEGSVAMLREQAALEQKKLDSLKSGTEEWNRQNEILKNTNDQLKKEIAHVERLNTKIEELPKVKEIKVNEVHSVKTENEDKTGAIPGWKPLPSSLSSGEGNGDGDVSEGTIEKLNEVTDYINNMSTSIHNLSSVYHTLRQDVLEGADGWTVFIDTLDASTQVISSVISVLQILDKVEKGMSFTKLLGPLGAVAALAGLLGIVSSRNRNRNSSGNYFAEGGIVGGTSFTGDRITANVNSGEMILNRTQQAKLFSMANGGLSGTDVQFHISGTELVGVLNNCGKKTALTR